jgi:hypothetical protein
MWDSPYRRTCMIKRSVVLLATLQCILWCAIGGYAAIPVLEPARKIQLQGGQSLDVGSGSAPTVVDWNNDSAMDLVVGQSTSSGKIRLYLNSGTDIEPIFNTYEFLRAKGTDITSPYC